MFERSHASIKALKIESGERRSLWHKHDSIPALNYNTSYHARIGCEPSRALHGRIPYYNQVWKTGIRLRKKPTPKSQIAQDVLDYTETTSQGVRKNAMQPYIKYKA